MENKIHLLWNDTGFGVYVSEYRYLVQRKKLDSGKYAYHSQYFKTLYDAHSYLQSLLGDKIEVDVTSMPLNEWRRYRNPYWSIYEDGEYRAFFKYDNWRGVHLPNGKKIDISHLVYLDDYEEAVDYFKIGTYCSYSGGVYDGLIVDERKGKFAGRSIVKPFYFSEEEQ